MEIKALADETLHPAVMGMAEGLSIGRILDVPAGQGALSLALKNKGFGDIHCLDINSENFKLKDVEFHQYNANDPLPYPDHFFDHVFSIEGIEHFESPWIFIKELCRVLKPGGTLLISTPNTLSVDARVKYLLSGYYPRFKGLMQDPSRLYEQGVDEAHICPIYFWQLYYFLTMNGLRLVDIQANRLVRAKHLLGRLFERLLATVIKKNIRDRQFPDHGVTSDAVLFGDCIILKLVKDKG
jgi:SAM-dependent methyltransferase